MDNPAFTYNKPAELEQAEDKIADILADAVYSYIIRKGIRNAHLADKFDEGREVAKMGDKVANKKKGKKVKK